QRVSAGSSGWPNLTSLVPHDSCAWTERTTIVGPRRRDALKPFSERCVGAKYQGKAHFPAILSAKNQASSATVVRDGAGCNVGARHSCARAQAQHGKRRAVARQLDRIGIERDSCLLHRNYDIAAAQQTNAAEHNPGGRLSRTASVRRPPPKQPSQRGEAQCKQAYGQALAEDGPSRCWFVGAWTDRPVEGRFSGSDRGAVHAVIRR